MARRRFEMFQYRQALVRMRQGDSDRQMAAARIMGRRTVARLRELGCRHLCRFAARTGLERQLLGRASHPGRYSK